MNFFENILSPIGKIAGGAQTAFNDAVIEGRKRKEAEALQKVIDLERQRQLAEQVASQPAPEGMATVTPEWGNPQSLELYQAYGQAGIDPVERAKAQTAQLASEAFANAIPNITSDVGRINIGLGKEYRPDVYQQDKIKADDAQIRLDTVEGLLNRPDIDPMISADIAQNKAVFDAQEVEIEGEDGKRHKAFANLTPSGNYVHATVTDKQGQPLVIPAESSKPTADMQNTKYYAQLWDMTEAEASKILKSRTTDTPEEAWAKIVNSKSTNRFGNNVKPYDMLKNSLMIWNTARQGQALPIDIQKTIASSGLNERQADELQGIANQINENAELIALSKLAEKEQASSGTANQSFPNIPGFTSLQQQPQQNTPFYQMPGVGVAGAPAAAQPPPLIPEPPLPQEPIPETQPLSIEAIATAWTDIAQKGKKPEEVRKDLMKQGFDLSPESINQMAMESMAEGTPDAVLQRFFATIGIDWQPT